MSIPATIYFSKPMSQFSLKIPVLILIFFSASYITNAQYYYKDIVSTRKENNEFSILKNSNIKYIKITSYDEHDQPSEGFFCEKRFNKDYTQSKLMTNSNITGESLLVTDYDKNGDVIKTTTTTPHTTNTVGYNYDSSGNIISIHTNTTAGGESGGITETHEYIYKDSQPVKMLRKKNNALISTITFVKDEKGNIIEEDPSGKSIDKKYFYYYDDSSRLTDVVHYNPVAQRLLPDYMLEYSNGNKPDKIISVDETGRNYFIWRYAYDDKKLPEIQKCYSKEKQLLGTIQYEYQ
jgi:YD repeat-containing protein